MLSMLLSTFSVVVGFALAVLFLFFREQRTPRSRQLDKWRQQREQEERESRKVAQAKEGGQVREKQAKERKAANGGKA